MTCRWPATPADLWRPADDVPASLSQPRNRRSPTAPGAVAIRGAACLLGAGCVVWATVPSVPKGLADFALFLAIFGVAAGALRLALAAVPVPEDNYLLSVPLRAWLRFLETLRLVPWEELALIAILWLEVLHPSRPWPTAVLGAALIGYLLATHLAETDASPRALRPQVRVLAAGAALLALGAGPGCSPPQARGGLGAAAPGRGGALIAAAALVLPYVARSD